MLLTDQCKPYLKTKIKGKRGYDNAHKSQDSIKLPELVRSVVCGVKAHLKGTWYMMKTKKLLYTFFQRRNTTKKDYMK